MQAAKTLSQTHAFKKHIIPQHVTNRKLIPVKCTITLLINPSGGEVISTNHRFPSAFARSHGFPRFVKPDLWDFRGIETIPSREGSHIPPFTGSSETHLLKTAKRYLGYVFLLKEGIETYQSHFSHSFKLKKHIKSKISMFGTSAILS